MSYLIKLILAGLLFMAAQQPNWAQIVCDTAAFDNLIITGDRFLEQPTPDYHRAMLEYTASMILCPERMAEAKDKILILFDRINDLKTQAENAKMEAQAERDRTNQALQLAELEKQKADISRMEAEAERNKANQALALANKIIDQFYFYKDKYALALKKDTLTGKNVYGFIDKLGNTSIDFIYDHATIFDENTGFAKVKIDDEYYLLEPNGKKYLLCDEIGWLNYTTEAVDFHYKGLHYFPPNLINFNNIKIIILSENFIKKIPSVISKISDNLVYLDVSKNRIKKISWEIGTVKKLRILNLSFNNIYEFPKELCLLTELTYLDLKDNHISSLPPEIGKLVNLCKLDLDNNELTSLPDELLHLSNLRYLSIQGNKLSKEEKENVSIMLPNCKINF